MMKFQPLSLLVFAVLTPSLAFSQNPQVTNCHTPESAGNFVGPDEIIVSDMVCKIVKTQPTQQQVVAQQPAAPAPGGQNQPTAAQGSVITNARVIELSKLGLDDDIIIAKIKNGSCQFQLEDTDLVSLKKAGVSPKVIAAMLDAGALTSPPVTVKKNELSSQSMGQSKVGVASENIPSEPGMYVAAGGGFTKILGQILEFKRSGSMLVSDLTLHVKTTKENVQLLGPHAQTVTGSNPEFYFIPAKQEADAGVNAGDMILVRLEEKKERRQIEVGAQGAWRASNGISLTHQVQLSRSEVKPGVYKITPAVGLGKGEYGIYLSRGEGMKAYLYDFSVQ
jgi:hypothetical protein